MRTGNKKQAEFRRMTAGTIYRKHCHSSLEELTLKKELGGFLMHSSAVIGIIDAVAA